MRRTKIVATLGPASVSPLVLARMIRAGLDVARLNFSHGTNRDHTRACRLLRSAAARARKHVGILLDLQGPRIRVGEMKGGAVRVVSGAQIQLTTRGGLGDETHIPVSYPDLLRDVKKGDRVLIDDGLVELRVTARMKDGLRARVVRGGVVADHKGVNFPGVRLGVPALTTKDRRDLKLGLDLGVDYVALSFVRGPEDIVGLRRLMRGVKHPPLVIAKIERREAIENLEAILDVADGVMVARGDLGVEYPTERVPILQKRIIDRANRREVLVITATQMLESMVNASRPTRAEASDVANAIFDGTDAVMLSAETAVGRYPDVAVATMARIASEADEFAAATRMPRRSDSATLTSPTHALAHTAYQAAREIRARSLVVFTHTGYSARLVSKSRPAQPILALSPLRSTCRRMALAWGVLPIQVPMWRTAEGMVEAGLRILIRVKVLRKGDWVVAMAGTTIRSGGTNMLRILQQGRPPDRPRGSGVR
ncbi:MAG TPA: pyruvate kinase [Candidatus Eisenbacteria bacterium]|nr:pyruvate kinase [Candidatus Eisenbacteria bacterium]